MEPHDDAVQAFVRTIVVPRRHREARLAPSLAGTERRTVATHAGSVTAWRLGDGPAVLLVHGWEDDSSLWEPLIQAIASKGRAVVAFDLPGHGFSEGDWGMTSEATDGVLAVADALGPVDAVVAHSFACGAATLAITEGLRADRFVMIAPPLGAGNRWLRKAAQIGVSQEVAHAAQTVYDQHMGSARAAFAYRPTLIALDLDLLLVHSRHDEREQLSDSQSLIGERGRGELFIVDGLSHRRTARDLAVVSRIAKFVSKEPIGAP